MSQNPNFFGARLRAMIEAKGLSVVAFARDYGLSEAQLHNWLKSEQPPLHKHWPRLAEYFDCSIEHIALGTLEKVEPDSFAVEEEQAPYGSATPYPQSPRPLVPHLKLLRQRLRTDIQELVDQAVAAAGDDVGDLGWIRRQLTIHLAIGRKLPVAEMRADVAKVMSELEAFRQEDAAKFAAIQKSQPGKSKQSTG